MNYLLKKIKRWFYYRITRLTVKAKWNKDNQNDLSNIQRKIMYITVSSISNEDSELLINPMIDYDIGEKYYIKKYNNEGDVEKFITISKMTSGYSISVVGHEFIEHTRHRYHFDVWFPDSFGIKMISRFKKNLKRKRDKMETEIRKDDEKTLDLILKKSKITKD